MLCLGDPAGESLNECAPALNKYYSIVKKTKLGGLDKEIFKRIDAAAKFYMLTMVDTRESMNWGAAH